MGRGTLNRFQDCRRNPLRVREHIVVPEAEDRPTLRFQIAGALCVRGERRVLTAVEFDDEPERAAGEIGDVVADDELARGTWVHGAEVLPEFVLGLGWLAAHPACVGGQLGWDALHVGKLRTGKREPLPTPSPSLPGRGASRSDLLLTRTARLLPSRRRASRVASS